MVTTEIPTQVEEMDMNSVMNEIWEMLKGQWSIERHDFTDVALNGQNVPMDDFVIPSEGSCKMIPRSSSDPEYDTEYLKTSAIHYRTRTGASKGDLIGTQGERFAFRRKDGIWSLWDVGGLHIIPYKKVADFRLKRVRKFTAGSREMLEVVLEAPSWIDEFGKNFFQMAFYKGTTLAWELRCRFDEGVTGTQRQWLDICVLNEAPRNDVETGDDDLKALDKE